MPIQALTKVLAARLDDMAQSGRLKGRESVIRGVMSARGDRGPRYLIADEGDKPFLRMNSNSYLGMALRREVVAAEEVAAASLGTGPGAVRFISGTWSTHIALEARLAAFHGRAAAMLFSSAYATVMGLIQPLVTDKTAVISDALNHNCIINAIALARPKATSRPATGWRLRTRRRIGSTSTIVASWRRSRGWSANSAATGSTRRAGSRSSAITSGC